MGVFLSADLFTAFVFFEVMSFTSFVLVIQTEEYQALKAGETYLAVAVIGGLAALAGLFLLYGQLGTLDLDRMGAAAAAVEDRTLLWAGSLLVLVGFGAKAGAFPLHIWLPTAHPAAPAPASAVLSGIIIKTGVYGILVLSTTIFLYDGAWGAAAGRHRYGDHGAGGGAGGVFHRPEAYPGLLLHFPDRLYSGGTAMMCLLGEHNALAVDGTILHILNHSLIKMVLFPLAGIIHLSTHSFDLNEIRGFGRGKPMLALLMGLPMLSLAGVPRPQRLCEQDPPPREHCGVHSSGGGVRSAVLRPGGAVPAQRRADSGLYAQAVCLSVRGEEPPAPGGAGTKSGGGGGEHYIAPASLGTIACYLLVMVRLGSEPNVTMDAVAAMTRGFLHGHAPDHPVDYFSPVNLEGAGISLAIGAVVYVLVVRLLLVRKKRYFDPIPPGLSLEYGLYRPLLDLLAKTAVVAGHSGGPAAAPAAVPGPAPGGSDGFTRAGWSAGRGRSGD